MTAPTELKAKTATGPVPPLRAGDRLTAAEFERRYDAMPDLKKAELIEGVVYMPSPVRHEEHGGPHFDLISWLGCYRAFTPGVDGGNNSTLRLDLDNRPQPDAFLRILPSHGGQSLTSEDGYVERAPELVAEVTASTASYDLHDKLNAYRRNAVQEYLIWRVLDEAVDWFVLRDERFERIAPSSDALLRSTIFPGLWLDGPALLGRDMARVLEVARQGTDSFEHRDFVRQLQQRKEHG